VARGALTTEELTDVRGAALAAPADLMLPLAEAAALAISGSITPHEFAKIKSSILV
jgi:hypothetical protein